MPFGDGSQGGNFTSSLKRLNGMVADMKLLPDADMNFLGAIEQMILARARQTVQAASGQGQGPPGMGGPAGMGGGGPSPVSIVDQARGLRKEPQMPPPDQMRSIIQSMQTGAQ